MNLTDYVVSQTSLDEMRRIYRFFEGKKRGMGIWLNTLKSMFPEAHNRKDSYYFDGDKVWDLIIKNEKWKQRVDDLRVESFWELSDMIIPYREYMEYYNDYFYDDDCSS